MSEYKYRIYIEYRTGDSFSSKDTSSYLDNGWNDLEVAKENLQRISKYNDWYESKDSRYKKPLPKPEFVKGEYDSLCLLTDGGVEYACYPFWTGYFETFYSAEIEVTKDNDMRIGRGK